MIEYKLITTQGREGSASETVASLGLPYIHIFVDRSGIRSKQAGVCNYLRALEEGDVNNPTVIFEDDIKAAKNWNREFEKLIEHNANFPIALYSPYPIVELNKPILVVYPIDVYYGTQGMFFPPQIRKLIIAGCIKAIEEKVGIGQDLIIRSILKHFKIPLLTIAPSLIQHMGTKSSIGNNFHQSPSFKEVL